MATGEPIVSATEPGQDQRWREYVGRLMSYCTDERSMGRYEHTFAWTGQSGLQVRMEFQADEKNRPSLYLDVVHGADYEEGVATGRVGSEYSTFVLFRYDGTIEELALVRHDRQDGQGRNIDLERDPIKIGGHSMTAQEFRALLASCEPTGLRAEAPRAKHVAHTSGWAVAEASAKGKSIVPPQNPGTTAAAAAARRTPGGAGSRQR